MSKKAYKSQASSAKAASRAFGGAFAQQDGAFSGGSTAFGGVASSPLSYVYEPPDLSGLSDPNVAVAFKNLQKKDGTTKSKALEDLQNYIGTLERDGLEEAVLEAWIKVYPRLSIDSSRRVRQLAHILQGQIAVSCGKRLAKHMPSIVSSWLAGLYDLDKSVNRAAQESFKQVFTSELKAKNVWLVYHVAIAEYVRNVLAKETMNTLSDERTTSPDESAAKYARVAGCAVSVLARLIEVLPQNNIEKSGSCLDGLLNEEALWKLSTHTDAFVRRAVFRLLILCLEKRLSALDSSMLSTNILTGGLHSSQVGSSLDYINAIVRLSKDLPTVWTTGYKGTGKKSASNRLRHYLRKGSQGGPAEYWAHLAQLFSLIPMEILLIHPASSEQADSDHGHQPLPILESLREGVTNKDELRSSSGPAWNTYLSTCNLVMSVDESTVVPSFLKSAVFPLINQYVRPASDQSGWTVVGSGAQQQDVCAIACYIALRKSEQTFEEGWHMISPKIIEDLQTSLPEQSKDYTKSQDSIAAVAMRWYRLQAALLGDSASKLISPVLQKYSPLEILAAISVVKARNGKPYGAAIALQTAIQFIPEIIFGESQSRDALIEFARTDIPHLTVSPSASYLISLLDLMDGSVDVLQAYPNCLQSLEESPQSQVKQTALRTLLSSPGLAKAGLLSITANKSLSHAIERAIKEDDDLSWQLVLAAMGNTTVSKALTTDILTKMTEGLSIENSSRASLHGLEMAAKQDRNVTKDFATQPEGSSLMSKLLFLTDAPDAEISHRAKTLIVDIEGALAATGDNAHTTRPLVKIVQREFEAAGPESLSIESLVGQAEKILKQTTQADLSTTVAELLPTSVQWSSALAPFVTASPNPSLAITNPFGTSISMIPTDASNAAIPATSAVPRDADGRSVLLRILQYVTRLAQVTELLSLVTEEQILVLLQNMALSLQLGADNLSVYGSMPLWITDDPDTEAEIAGSIFEAQMVLASWLHSAETSILVPRVQFRLLRDSEGLFPSSYYHARAYKNIQDDLVETQGQTASMDNADRIKAIRRSPNVFADMAILMSSGSKDAMRPCNEMLSDLTNYKFDTEDTSQQSAGLCKLLLLNCLLQRPDELVYDIPQQRLVFFVQHVVGELGNATFALAMEIVRSLNVILPAVKDIYGSFWGDVLDFTKSMWQFPLDDGHLPGRHACSRLCATLKKPNMLEANDDLLDAWTERKEPIMRGLVRLLGEVSQLPDESHQPRRIFNELLSRLLSGSSELMSGEEETLYSVLASESVTLQQTAYELLHEQIPSKQEQLSLDKALTKDHQAKLPEELLSLILTPPTLLELSEASFERNMPSSLRGYLLSWKLVFDHWRNASNLLQADYAKSLTDGTHLKDFLDLTFKILISTRGKPVDASKFDIGDYIADREPPDRDTHWLLIHLYYLCLMNLPTQTKSWWRDTTSRQINIAVQTWTERYISKLIIASELDAVRQWAPSQTNGDQPLAIKVSSSAREITGSIPVDEQNMVLAIRLPPSYPLARAEVEGVHRVGVSEKKWTSWIRNAQGQLTIAGEGGSNALIDCLLAWRKNVTAAMKGQSECAICYSVVGADRTLPSKVCKTCKNKFHGSCLFRWFSSSNSSSCPLCRNTFTYS